MKTTQILLNHKNKSNLKLWFLVFLAIMLVNSVSVFSQTVSHSVSGITSSMSKFTYSYLMSPTQKKDIEYIIVLSSTSEVKTVFNACDVCYQSHKGYAQNGAILVCNNCGNKFQITALGNKNTAGTCSPGYLPHTIENGNIVIKVSDLILGEYFFLSQNISNVNDDNTNPSFQLYQNNSYLLLKMNNSIERNIKILSITGQICKNISDSNSEVNVNISELLIGAYLISIEESGKTSTQSFYVY